jgi:hypothetical protein
MDFGTIRQAVVDAWGFIWPPVLACVIALAIFRYFYPPTTTLAHQLTLTAQERSGAIESLRSALEPYGLSKAIPLAALVLLIAMLYIVNSIVFSLSSNLPPYTSYSPDALLEERISDKDRLLLFRKYPTAEHLNAAYNMAVGDWRITEHGKIVFKEAQSFYRVEYFLKFSLLIGLVAFVVAVRGGSGIAIALLKLLVLVLVLALFWCINFAGLLYAAEQDFMREWSSVRLSLQKDAGELLKEKATEEEMQHIERTSVQTRWWRVYFFDPYRVTWFKRTFLTRPTRAPNPYEAPNRKRVDGS